MRLFLALATLFPLAASSLSHNRESQNQNLQAISNESSKHGLQIKLNEYSTRNYSSNNVKPLSSTSIPPWNDSDRSEILNYLTKLTTCPRRYLNCRRCPHDRRCWRPGLRPTTLLNPSSSMEPSSTPVYKPRPHVAPDLGDPAALTGPQLKPLPEVGQNVGEDGNENRNGGCQLSKCDKMVTACGSGAVCSGGYCACTSGLKSSTAGTMGRGREIPESATVYVNIGVACDQSCDDMFCTEVRGLDGCFRGDVGTNDGTNGVDTINTAGHGAIQMPGTGGIDGDGPFPVGSGNMGNA